MGPVSSDTETTYLSDLGSSFEDVWISDIFFCLILDFPAGMADWDGFPLDEETVLLFLIFLTSPINLVW